MTTIPNHPTEPAAVDFLLNLSGPYSATNNGTCADGHPLNGFGRCDVLNGVQFAAAGLTVPTAAAPQ